MPTVRRGQGGKGEQAIRPTLGPLPSAWDAEFPISWTELPGDEDSELPADRFFVTTIAPHGDDPNEEAITREQYYAARGVPETP